MTIFDPIEFVNGEVINDGSTSGGSGGSGDADDIPDPDANREQEIPNILYRTPTGHIENLDHGPLVRISREIFGMPGKQKKQR